MSKNLFLVVIALAVGCGKLEKVQDSFIALSGNNDLTMVEVRVGAIYRNNPATQPQGYDFIEFENTQYRLGTISTEVAPEVAKLPRGQLVPVYFKGQFVRRSGVSTTNPNVEFDVIDLTAITKK
jgi:hypothetical protein